MSLRSALIARLKNDPTALRAEVLRTRRGRNEPDEPDNPFTRTGKMGIIQDAVEFRQQLAFFYNNTTRPEASGRRVGNPHGVFRANGKTYLLMWTLPGSTSGSGAIPGWRTFIVSQVRNPQIIRQTSVLTEGLQEFLPAPGYRRFRRGQFLFRV
jgi:hypothetical protein